MDGVREGKDGGPEGLGGGGGWGISRSYNDHSQPEEACWAVVERVAWPGHCLDAVEQAEQNCLGEVEQAEPSCPDEVERAEQGAYRDW